MKIYNVIVADRHSDTEAIPFLDLEKAKEFARSEGRACAINHPDEYVEDENVPDRLLQITYSCEGDCIWITEHEVAFEKSISDEWRELSAWARGAGIAQSSLHLYKDSKTVLLEKGTAHVSQKMVDLYGIKFIQQIHGADNIIIIGDENA